MSWLLPRLLFASLALVDGLHAPLPRRSQTPANLHFFRRRAALPHLTSITPEETEKKRQLDADFVKIAAPAFVQFAAEPLARLIDTAYLGRLGANALGGAGAAIAAQYSVSKLYNDPLLRTTISIVAAQEGAEPRARADAVSAALLLALFVGIAQGTAFFILAGPVLSAMSVGTGSAMRASALGYLRVCSCGAPAVTLWLATNGIFRGLGDTTTPLIWALAFTAMNAGARCAQTRAWRNPLPAHHAWQRLSAIARSPRPDIHLPLWHGCRRCGGGHCARPDDCPAASAPSPSEAPPHLDRRRQRREAGRRERLADCWPLLPARRHAILCSIGKGLPERR